MAMKLSFSSIQNENIFQPEFKDLNANGNNVIEFRKQPQAAGGIAVVYAPNGTGKSSFTRVLGSEVETEEISFKAKFNDRIDLSPETHSFHIIGDQISRNVIRGETSDYLIGADIKQEYKLKKNINEGFENVFLNLNSKYKKIYNIKKVSNYLLSVMKSRNEQAYTFIRDIINQQSKGKNVDRSKFISYVRDLSNKPCLSNVDNDKKKFILENTDLVQKLNQTNLKAIAFNINVQKIEQFDDAITILTKYKHLNSCVVCDNKNIDSTQLLETKQDSRKIMYDDLDENTKHILDDIVKNKTLLVFDPFKIKSTIDSFIINGNDTLIKVLFAEIKKYSNEIVDEMISELFNEFTTNQMFSWWDQYTQLLEKQPTLDNEELLLINEIIVENIGHDITVQRDKDNGNNFKLMFDDRTLIGLNREEMHLSSGEQNFISLAFELLLARHSDQEFVVLDDPISSFDSVYKNKIAYCIIKFLEKKKQIVLTHNTDLIRLLNVQLKNCFNLYILNNADGGRNGFIPVKSEERDILINLSDLVKLFQNKGGKLETIIHDKRLFLMAMIPFLRGYFHIIKDPKNEYCQLSKVMHGYEEGSIDIAAIYKEAFDYSIESEEIISVEDVLSVSTSNLDIIDENEYPLLADTLKQTLIYYHIRMKVEHELVDIFNIHCTSNEILMLINIIQNAFRVPTNATQEQINEARQNRVFFTSRKTLLNEFNHFEGNMNIFQPAIDINETVLQKEVTDIENKLKELRNKYAQIY